MSNQEFGGEEGFSPIKPQGETPTNREFGGERPPRREFGGERSFGDRPPRREFGGDRSFGDRPPRREFGGDRPAGERSFGGDRGPRREFGGDRSFGDRPPRRDFGGDRPAGERSFGGDRGPRREFGGDRSFGDRPPRRDFGGDRAPRREFDSDRFFEDRPPRRDFGGDRSFGDRPPRRDFGGDRPAGERSFGGDRGPRREFGGDRPQRGRSQEELPQFLRKVEALKTEKGREREGSFLVEGIRCLKEVLAFSPEVIEKVYYIDGFSDQDLLAELDKKKVKAEALPANQFEALSSTTTSQGILAVARPAPIKPNWETAQVVTLVDGVQDPGNLGSIFRSCLGFGVDALVLGKGTCDPFNPKVVRGSSGTFLRVPFEQYANLPEKILFLLTKGFSVVATTPHAVQSIADIKLRKKVAFLIGNEGNGADARLIDMCTEQVKIPMADGLESLNVAVAHGVLAYELSKTRTEA